MLTHLIWNLTRHAHSSRLRPHRTGRGPARRPRRRPAGHPPRRAAGRPGSGHRRRPAPAPSARPPLAEVARGRKNACILICDITRPVPNSLILPPLLRTLEEQGIARRDILILIATGLHRPNEGAELVEMVGAGDRRQLPHREPSRQGPRGARLTSARRPTACRSSSTRRYVRADLKITTGLIEPHLMAGYSGGRKVICPGIAGAGDGQGLARAEVPRASRRPTAASWRAIPSTRRTRASP